MYINKFFKNIYIKDIQFDPDQKYLESEEGDVGNTLKGDFIIFTKDIEEYIKKNDIDKPSIDNIINKFKYEEVTVKFRDFHLDIVHRYGIKKEQEEGQKAGKRKSRRNRKSKKGKRSRKARKSRRKSNRRRGRR